MSLTCSQCGKSFSRSDNIMRHVRSVHDKQRYPYPICQRPFADRSNLNQHVLSHTGVRSQAISEPPLKRQRISNDITFTEKHVSTFRRVQCYTLSTQATFSDLWTLYKRTKEQLKHLLAQSLTELQMIKFDIVLSVNFKKATDPNETISCFFHSGTKRGSTSRQLQSLTLNAFQSLTKQVEDYLERGSGWVIASIHTFDVHISKYLPIRGSSYLPLPAKLRHRRAVINIKNRDNKCFMWAIFAALHPVEEHTQRTSHYQPYLDSLDFTGIDFPVSIEDVETFEHLNSLSINIYGYTDEEDEIKVLHLTENPDTPDQISLLLYNKQHYCWIKDPERFLRAENGKTQRQFQCHRCLKIFWSIQKRDKHVDRCKEPDLDSCEMPDDPIFKFTNVHKMQRLPYAIYADCECLLEKEDTCLPTAQSSHTTVYQQHKPCGYGVAEVFGCCSDNVKLGEANIYRGEDPVTQFLDQAIQWGEQYQDQYNRQLPIEMNQQDDWHFNNTTTCNICKESLGEDRVADHCHFCGSYRGACHSHCNLQYRLSREVVVMFHNLRRYDGHLLLKKLGHVASQRKGAEIKVIPKGMDDDHTFSLRLRHHGTPWLLKFIDSYQFLTASLGKLVDNLHDKGVDRFAMMAPRFTPQQLPTLLRKGVYPYDYMDSWSRFDETKLPSAEKFNSTLTGEDISHGDYQHAQRVWNQFNIKNMGEYHDLYLITDVLLLADVFENFRSFCLYNYELDPALYFTAPSLIGK